MRTDHPVGISLFRTDLPDDQVDVLSVCLSADENDRANRYHQPADRRRAVVSRACLRFLLAERLGADPASIRFQLNSFGKPLLVPTPGSPDIRFNVSHSGNLAAVAIALGRTVGIDIECWGDPLHATGEVEQYFAEEERLWLRMSAPDSAPFYSLWTAKESVVKAVGEGLSISLDSFFVLPSASGPIPVSFRDERAAPVFVYCLPLGSGYSGAVAACGKPAPTIEMKEVSAMQLRGIIYTKR